jgi:nucleoporin NUP82
MFAVYEAIDLGLISRLSCLSAPDSKAPLLDLLKDSYPVFFSDPIHDDVVYVSHMCGVHSLHFRPMLQSLAAAMHVEDEEDRETPVSALENAVGATVKPLMDTFIAEQSFVRFFHL